MSHEKDDDDVLKMTKDDLQQWIQTQVEQSPNMVQRNKQLTEVEAWLRRKERESTYNRLLYNNACEAILECESVLKGLYGMLGWDYQEQDSEAEGDDPQEVIQIADGDDERQPQIENICKEVVGGDEDMDLVQIVSKNSSVESASSLLASSASLASSINRPSSSSTPEINCSQSVSPEIMDSIKIIKTESLLKTPPKPIKSEHVSNDVVPQPLMKTEPELVHVSPWEMGTTIYSNSVVSVKEEPQATKDTSSPMTPNKQSRTSSKLKSEPQLLSIKQEQSPPSISNVISLAALKTEPQQTSMVAQVFRDSERSETPKSELAKKASEVTGLQGSEIPTNSIDGGSASVALTENISDPEPMETEEFVGINQMESTRETPAQKPSLGSGSEQEKSLSAVPNTKETPAAQSHTDSNDDSVEMEDSSTSQTQGEEPPQSTPGSETGQPISSSSKEPSDPAPYTEITLKVGTLVLGKKKHSSWSKGTVKEIQTEDNGQKYIVEFKKGKKMTLPSNLVAVFKSPVLKDLRVGSRVVCGMKEEKNFSYKAGVLVQKVWREIKDKSLRNQVKEYIEVYPNPISVVLRIGQDTKVERNGQFESSKVLQLDGSLIQISFMEDNHIEWVYKGSDRLEHIVKIKKRLKKQKTTNSDKEKTHENQQTPAEVKSTHSITTVSTKPQNNPSSSTTTSTDATSSTSAPPKHVTQQSEPIVPKTSSMIIQKFNSPSFQPKILLQRLPLPLPIPSAPLSTSRLRSAKRAAPIEEEEEEEMGEDDVFSEEGEEPVSKQEANKSRYIFHRCCSSCLEEVRPPRANYHLGRNPLLIPLLFKFRRMTARRRIDGQLFFHIFYRSPCGRSLCDMEEVQKYLFETRCDFLFLEMFCMDPFVLVNRARPPSTVTNQPFLHLPDISMGRELLPVPCVNEVDKTPAPIITYTRERIPAPEVTIDASSDFLIGCDCTDGCQDRSKCACHQLTIEATSLCSGGPVDVSAGYTHKRLTTSLPTGVYECNPLCRCDPRMCSNRLVQHGLQLRLELFMTQHKGWGIRCRDDVAKGSFVCVFTGKVINEDKINEDDSVTGNEYLANLDFIEGVEKLKEGYESEVYCSDNEVEGNKKTITMKTGPLLKDTLFREDSSSGEEREEPMQQEREKKDASKESLNEKVLSQMPHESFVDFLKKLSSHVKNDGQETLGPKRSFAKKSVQKRVKSLECTDSPNEKAKAVQPVKNTRRLFNEDSCYIIDARQQGNLGRFINHSCSPNLFVQNVFVDTHDLRFPWVAFFASRRIKAGTELTWDYNYEVGSVEGKVLLCCCGSQRCTGRLL
ncbi:hypothetical protein DNTS_009666 [Danionella cerebrum]|uniref:[histone H3]-lysine(4) N-trimethyltransferase n=1 Tax=Danionella cerebrum TaxID=2873325 RepID=A0A553NI86_9TELE|nr:hypothetical protein DNTS_009666 [Danionella translucida]TRY65110.1 hypothetical protein DNTS_009666 [Danionella translucida]